jgi:hypothetical protein
MNDASPTGFPAGADVATPTRSRRGWALLFGVVLLLHFYLVTRSWSAGEFRGHEFRQAQTALSAYFIQQDDDFSIAYPTPVLGKPWSAPMEFPLYQWCVVGVSNALDLPLAPAGRMVSLFCFYATLPALFLLLAFSGVPAGARWAGLALVLASPLYIFYTRAFLIESTALLLAAWFLAAFLPAIRTGHPGWVLSAVLTGAGAALVKVTTLLIWLLPAAAYGLLLLYRQRDRGGRVIAGLLGRGAVLAAGPCLAALWWVGTADAIKARNPSARFLMSDAMQWFNFGSWSLRFSAETWSGILENWHTALMPLWLSVPALAVVVASPWRRRVGWAVLVVCAAFLTFPRLFSWHDYYLYPVGVLWLLAVGTGMHWLATEKIARPWGGLVLVAALLGGLNAYRLNYYPTQVTSANGGSGLTEALRELLPRDAVLVVAGDDWSAITPYYARRRALMIRDGTENDPAYLVSAFAGLAGEQVGALVLKGRERQNAALLALAVRTFDLHPDIAFSHRDTDVYLPRDRRDWTVAKLQAAPIFDQVVPHGKLLANVMPPDADPAVKMVNLQRDQPLFGHLSPMPVRYHFSYDPNVGQVEGATVIGAHPDAEMWFAVPPGRKEIVLAFGIFAGAYERTGPSTDGVDFIVEEHKADGSRVEVFRRSLQPAGHPQDRGLQRAAVSCQVAPGSELVFLTRSRDNAAFDWAYWGPISIR